MLTLLISRTLSHSVRVLKKNQMKNLKLSYLTFFIVPIVFGSNHVKEPIWTISLKGDGLPPKVEYADTSVIIVSYIDSLYCLDNKTGKTIFTSEFEYFSELHFDSCLYFFKDKDLFVKINPFSPDEEWELQATNYSFYQKKMFKKGNKLYIAGVDSMWEVNTGSLQIIKKHAYLSNNFEKDGYTNSIYADDENMFYVAGNKLYIKAYTDSTAHILLDSLSIKDQLVVKRNNNVGYYILSSNFESVKIYRLENDRKLLKIHEAVGGPADREDFFGDNKLIHYVSGVHAHVIIYSLQTEAVLLDYSFGKLVLNAKIYDGILVINEIVTGNDNNQSTLHFIDIDSGELIRKIKFDKLVYEFEIVGNKIYYSMDNSVSCSEI